MDLAAFRAAVSTSPELWKRVERIRRAFEARQALDVTRVCLVLDPKDDAVAEWLVELGWEVEVPAGEAGVVFTRAN